MKIMSGQVRWSDDMPEPESELWIDGFDWPAVIASGHPEERAVETLADAQVEVDRASEAPAYDVQRVERAGVTLMRAMQEALGWSQERYTEMLALWAKAYKREFESRDDLDRFLRSVGQKR